MLDERRARFILVEPEDMGALIALYGLANDQGCKVVLTEEEVVVTLPDGRELYADTPQKAVFMYDAAYGGYVAGRSEAMAIIEGRAA